MYLKGSSLAVDLHTAEVELHRKFVKKGHISVFHVKSTLTYTNFMLIFM
jgi:hypothetical protein